MNDFFILRRINASGPHPIDTGTLLGILRGSTSLEPWVGPMAAFCCDTPLAALETFLFEHRIPFGAFASLYRRIRTLTHESNPDVEDWLDSLRLPAA